MFFPKDFIQEIRTRQLSSDKEYVLDSLTGAIDRLQKAFPRFGSFLMEFIQNADDAKSGNLRIEISENSTRIMNDGIEFCDDDVKSICKVGRSSKTPKDYIGYLGVGFKAVFLISQRPEVHSGQYHFKFDKNLWENPSQTPWQVIPTWVDDVDIETPGDYTTVFNLPLKEPNLTEKLQDEIQPENLSNRILLFLRNIKRIQVMDYIKDSKREITKSMVDKSSDYEIYQIEEYLNGVLSTQDYWLIFRAICGVPKDVGEDYITKEWERDSVEKREIITAFKLDKEKSLVKEERGTAHIGVFSFLPLKELPSGLNFLIQADFLTTPGRVELARESLWNRWLATEIYNLIVNQCIPRFMKHDKWRLNFTELLYSSSGGHELFESYIKKPLRAHLESNTVLIAEDDSTIEPSNAVSISPKIAELTTADDFETLYPEKKVLHSDCEVPWNIKQSIEDGPDFNATNGISGKMPELLELKVKKKDTVFFKKFYRKLFDYAESTLKSSPLRNQNIILTDDNNLTDSRAVYIKPKDLVIPEEIKANFRLVHADLVDDAETLESLKKLGIEELTAERVQRVLKTKEIPAMGMKWSSYSDNERIEKTKLCKRLWEENQIGAKDMSFLTLESKNGKWLAPNDLVFSKEYKPDHRIEELSEKGILKQDDLQRLDIEFLNTAYVSGENDVGIKNWLQFLQDLEVEGNLNRVKIVERIGINVALMFEEKHGRKPKELSRSEEGIGFDIESDFGKRLIEVKSRSDPSPQIWLTTKQLKKLQSEGKKYFIYVIRDALKYPVLAEIRGSELLEVEYSISIDFYKWRDLSEEEFQP